MACLTGCSDAVAKLKDSKEVVLSIGKEIITKGDLFTSMKQSFGASTVNSMALKQITAIEVPIDDNMKKTAQDTLTSYKSMYGDGWGPYLAKIGMNEEQYINEYLVPAQQAKKLAEKYISDNFDAIVKKYQPVQATVVSFTSEQDANAALAELKGGNQDVVAVGKAHNSSNTLFQQIFTLNSKKIDALVRNAIQSQTVEAGWTSVKSSDGASFNLVRVDSKDSNAFKTAAIDVFKKDQSITSDSNTFYFKKYNFHVYDKVIYDALKTDFPNTLVQDK